MEANMVEAEKIQRLRTTKDYYIQLLGKKEFPKNPGEMPGSFFLPKEALGDLERAILNTNIEDVEYSQRIFWDKKSGSFISSRLFRGHGENPVLKVYHTSLLDLVSRVAQNYFGDKPLITYHTHPGTNWLPSLEDVAVFKSHPRSGYIMLIGANYGASAVLQTQQVDFLPVSSTAERIWTQIEENVKIKAPDSYYKFVKYMQDLGFAFYRSNAPNGQFKAGYLEHGLRFSRVHTA